MSRITRPRWFVQHTASMAQMRLSAVTLHVRDMATALRFYDVLGGSVVFGGPDGDFTSIRLGGSDIHDGSFLNLSSIAAGDDEAGTAGSWGRWILHVPDPDDVHRRFAEAGFRSETDPADAPWGERYFHIRDPDGHELSVSTPLD